MLYDIQNKIIPPHIPPHTVLSSFLYFVFVIRLTHLLPLKLVRKCDAELSDIYDTQCLRTDFCF